MELNADFTRRVSVHTSRMPWVPSPMAGVERRMLDRIGGEVARATSIVRYAPGSRFSPHSHEGGEEFLVLEGVFQDEHGDYPPGTYVRNPPGSRHTPGSGPGCVIFVKLRQFAEDDRVACRIDTGVFESPFPPCGEAVEVMPLFRHGTEEVRLVSYPPNARVARQVPGGLELLVLRGELVEQGERLATGSWLRLPDRGAFAATSGPEGAVAWVKTGHLSGHEAA